MLYLFAFPQCRRKAKMFNVIFGPQFEINEFIYSEFIWKQGPSASR